MDKLFFGGRGSGKTFGAIIEMWIDWIRGNELWSNTPLNEQLPHKYVDTLELIEESFIEQIPNDGKQRTCLIDETHTQADSRTSSKHTNRQLVNFVSQARKRNFKLLYTSQFLVGFDIRLRALTDRVVRCVPIMDVNDIGMGTPDYPEPLKFQYFVHIPQEGFRLENAYSIPRNLARLFYDLYSTEQPIMPIEYILQQRSESQ